MRLQTIQSPEEISVTVMGDLDLASVVTFQSAVEHALSIRKDRQLVIDLRDTDYVDSAGLEQLLIANRKLMVQKDRLKVRVKTGSQPRTVLNVTGFGTVMDVEAD